MAKKVTIAGVAFEVAEPYSEGYTINAFEARALNQTWAEGLGNNFRKKIKDAGDDEAKLEAIRNEFAEAAKTYNFSAARTGSGRIKMDPVDREAYRLARNFVNAKILELGTSVKDYKEKNPEKYEANVDRVAALEETLSVARATVKSQQKAAERTGASLDL